MVTILKQNLTHFVCGTKAYAKAFVHIAKPIKIDLAIYPDNDCTGQIQKITQANRASFFVMSVK
jgi:hypothetical protein